MRRKRVFLLLVTTLIGLACIGPAQEDEDFVAELDGRKTWTVRYGFGSPIGLAGVGLSAGRLALDQTLAVDLRAEALSILTVEGHFDDQQADSLQSLAIYLDTERLDGVLGDFSVAGLSGFSTHRRKMLGGQLEYTLGEATITGVAAQFQGITETKTFIGETADAEVVYSTFDPDRPWVEQPYLRRIEGLFAYPLETLYVEELSTLRLVLDGAGPVRPILEAYGLGYLVETLAAEPETDVEASAYTVVGEDDQTLLLNVRPRRLIRSRLKDAIGRFNEENDLSGSDRRTYPFIVDSTYESSFLDGVAEEASLRVDSEAHPILGAVRRRFYDLGQTGVIEDSLIVSVSEDGVTYTSIRRPELDAYDAALFAEDGILELDFPSTFFDGEEASIRAQFSYSVTGGAYSLGISLIPGSERVTLNGTPLSADDYEIDYEIGLLILLVDVTSTDVIQIEYERFGSGLGGASDYARYFLGLTLDLPVSEALEVTATVMRGIDDASSVTDPEKVRTMPNRQLVGGVLGTIAFDEFDARFALGYGVDEFPIGDNERPAAPNEATAIAANDEYLFIGHRGGFSVLHEGNWRAYGVSDGLSGRTVRAIVIDEDRVYIGTNAGLTVIELKGVAPLDRVASWSRYGETDGVPDASIYGLALLGERLWAAGKGTLVSVGVADLSDPTGWIQRDVSDLASITTLAEDGEALYIGTTSGAYRFDAESGDAELLAGTGGFEIASLTGDAGYVYVASQQGLRAYQSGVGTGWVTWGTPVLSAAASEDDLYYGTEDALVRGSDGATVVSGRPITALSFDEVGSLWAGSRADDEYRLMVWQCGDRTTQFDNNKTKIDGRDPTRFTEILPSDHTTEGLFGRASFQHDADRLTLSGSVDVVSSGYRAIGDAAGAGSTAWELDADYEPFDAIAIAASHEYASTGTTESPRQRVQNRVLVAGRFEPTITLSVDHQAVNSTSFHRGPETESLSYQFSVADSLFADRLDLSVSWRDATSNDRLDETVRRENRLSAGADLELGPSSSVSIEWRRPLRDRGVGWEGSAGWTFAGASGARVAFVAFDVEGEIDLSRSLPDGVYRSTSSAEADVDLDAFDLFGWHLTPTSRFGFAREDGETTLDGRAVVRGDRGDLTVRATVTGKASGLASSVTRTEGKLSVAATYSGSERWSPSLTFTTNRSDTIQHGVGSATALDHSLLLRSSWAGDLTSNTLSFSFRLRDARGGRRITGSIEDSYELDLTPTLTEWLRHGTTQTASDVSAKADAVPATQTPSRTAFDGAASSTTEVESEAPVERGSATPYPTAYLRVDASGDYRAAETETDVDLTVAARLDVAISETWGASLSTSYIAGTKSAGGLYHSFLLELTLAINF